MESINSISFVIMLITLLVLTGYSVTSLGFNFVGKPVPNFFSISGLIQDDMINSNNFYEYSENYDNYIRVSTENNEEPTDDICGKLLEDCQAPATETNTTTESKNNNLGEIYKKYLEQSDVDNRTAPTLSDGGPKGTEMKNENVTQITDGSFQIYENPELGIRILYPAGWEKKEEPTAEGVRFISSREAGNDTYAQTIDLFAYPSMSVNQATESLTNYYKTSLKNFTTNGSPHASVNANFSSVSLNYTYNDDKSGSIRSMDFIVSPVSNDKTYLFTFRDEASSFDKDLPEVQKILNSVNFLK